MAVLGVEEDELGHAFDPFRAKEAEIHHNRVLCIYSLVEEVSVSQ